MPVEVTRLGHEAPLAIVNRLMRKPFELPSAPTPCTTACLLTDVREQLEEAQIIVFLGSSQKCLRENVLSLIKRNAYL